MAGYKQGRSELPALDVTEELAPDVKRLRRSLLVSGLFASVAFLCGMGLTLAGRRPSAHHAGLSSLLANTPLSGIILADLALVAGGAFAVMAVTGARRRAAIKAEDGGRVSEWGLWTALLPSSLIALVSGLGSVGRGTDLLSFGHGALVTASSLVALLAFIFLFQERSLLTARVRHVAEASGLAALMRLVIVTLLITGFLTGCAASGLATPVWLWKVPAFLVMYAVSENLVRLILAWLSSTASAGPSSISVGNLLFGNPWAFRPAQIALMLKTNFGIDFERSWALDFVRRAALPVTVGMLALGWVFSGVVKIDQNRRGIYERFGRPITVLGPGLHIVLPRPFGQVRLTEFGTIRSLVLTDNADAAKASVDTATAEGDPPDSANRLWDNSPEDATCLVARTAEGGGGFEMLTVNLRVLYRVRQSDQGAMDALYNVSSPDALLRSLAHRELVRFFASETLEGVMATRRDTMADIMARHVQQELDRHKAGIEIVAVIVDSIQPPAAAAQSWRAVQAAEVKAQMSVAEERARAMGTAALARKDAYTQQASALAQAASIRMEAQANATRMIGDDRSWQTGGRAFLLERYLGGLKAALGGAAMTVLDSRLPGSFLDLRDGAPVSSPPVDDVMAK